MYKHYTYSYKNIKCVCVYVYVCIENSLYRSKQILNSNSNIRNGRDDAIKLALEKVIYTYTYTNTYTYTTYTTYNTYTYTTTTTFIYLQNLVDFSESLGTKKIINNSNSNNK